MGSGLAQERAPERRVTRKEGWYYINVTGGMGNPKFAGWTQFHGCFSGQPFDRCGLSAAVISAAGMMAPQ
jgi:hypothetical protein